MTNGLNHDAGQGVGRRRQALGLSNADLHRLSGVAPDTIASVESGRPARPSSLHVLVAALDRHEADQNRQREPAKPMVAAIELPNGIRVTYTGSVDDVTEAVERFLSRRSRPPNI